MSSIQDIIGEFLRIAKTVKEALPPHKVQGAAENDEEFTVETLGETRLERCRIGEKPSQGLAGGSWWLAQR